MKRKLLYGKYDESARKDIEQMRSKGRSILNNKLSLNSIMVSNKALENDENSDESVEEVDILNDQALNSRKGPALQIEAQNTNPWLRGLVTEPTDNMPKKSDNTEFDMNTAVTTQKDIQGDRHNGKSITVAEAFASDDVIAHFDEMKKQEIAEDRKKLADKDNFLSGWGQWSGPGTVDTTPAVKRAKFVEKTPKAAFNRRDKHLKHVIINENANRPVKNLQVSKLPHPFTNVRDFENCLATPLGSDWNTPSAATVINQPRITVQKGKTIKPMQKSDYFGATRLNI